MRTGIQLSRPIVTVSQIPSCLLYAENLGVKTGTRIRYADVVSCTLLGI